MVCSLLSASVLTSHDTSPGPFLLEHMVLGGQCDLHGFESGGEQIPNMI